ncbi:MAG: transglycosylase domain-containing protein, partial [Oscillospiraceae bacterium]|nr:transglycosylase domain-containing protein [Oscillospiraceae bacterium]
MESANPQGRRERKDPPREKPKKRFSILGFFSKLLLFLFTLCVIGVLTTAMFLKIFMTYINTTLIPSLEEITLEEMTLSLPSTIYYEDANGQQQVLRTLHNSESNRELIEFEDLPKHLVDAIVAIEDHRFWDHHGVDWYGTARATLSSATGQGTQGGSTITQQLVRNMTEEYEVTVKRKLREIIRSLDFDAKNTKEDILTMYLNKVYFGHGFSGIQTAAKGYFGKDVSELNLAESASIVGITNYPTLYDPLWEKEFPQKDGTVKTPRDFNKERQGQVLDAMAEYGFITEEEAEAAKAVPLNFVDNSSAGDDDDEAIDRSDVWSWFEDQVINDAIGMIAQARGIGRTYASELLYSGGYHIYTTLDMDIQNIVDSVYLDRGNFNYKSANGTPLDSAVTVMDPYTGEVVAMAGGVGEKSGNRILNLATTPRQPGSSIKPMSIYGPGLEYDVVSPMSIIDDYPVQVNDSGTGGYPKNSPAKYVGPVTVRTGVQNSINTVAVRILQKLGVTRSFEFMEKNLGMDLETHDLNYSPLALGGLTIGVSTMDVAAAYSAFANRGIYSPPHTIRRIESNDHSEVIADNSGRSYPAMKETTAYLMTSMLQNAVANGTGTQAQISGMHVAGKTGTTTDNCDRYFAGFTPYYTAAVWVGHAKANERIDAGKVNPAAVVWQKIMSQVHAGLEDKSFPDRPSGITTASVCGHCGGIPSGMCNDVVSGEIQASAAPSESCSCHVEVRICTDPATGDVRLAGQYCPANTVSTQIMQKGREFLELPNGNLVTSNDASEHLTYFSSVGKCKIHDESYAPEEEEPVLPEEADPNNPENPTDPNADPQNPATPQPGDTSWPTGTYSPSTPAVNPPASNPPAASQPTASQPTVATPSTPAVSE